MQSALNQHKVLMLLVRVCVLGQKKKERAVQREASAEDKCSHTKNLPQKLRGWTWERAIGGG